MPSRLQEIQTLLKDGHELYISVKITAIGQEKEDESLSTTLIYNGTITAKSRQKYMMFGISFSPKKLLAELERLEKEEKLKVRKAGDVYLLDGEEGRVYATIKVAGSKKGE